MCVQGTGCGTVRVQLDCPGGDTDEDTTMCQPTGGSPDGSGMSREAHVPFYEGLGVQFPRPTHRAPQQAVGKMTDGPSTSAVRSRLQTTPSGCHEEWRS